MPANRDQHFVPQFYFRNFGRRKQIAIFNIASRTHIANASIRGQCQREWIYGRDLKIERALQDLEGVSREAICAMIRTERAPQRATPPHFHVLTFIAFQRGRTPKAGREMEDLVTGIARSYVGS